MIRALLFLLSLIAIPGPSSAVTLARHEGANDPTSEGWTFNNFGDALGFVGPVPGDGPSGLDAWLADDEGTDSSLSYVQDLTGAVSSLDAGWRYSALLRTDVLPDPVDFGVSAQVENGSRAFAMIFGTGASGDLLVSLSGVGSVAAIAGGSSDYQLFEFLEEDPTTVGVDFYVNGALILAGYSGLASTRALVAFGDTSTTEGAGGEGRYSSVVLTTIPEPGTALLLGLGLGLIARSGHPNESHGE